jgi:hypothetical protein
MAYWLDEAWHRWPQIDEVGTAAAGLYSRCGAYIADEGTDGFIPTARARMYGTLEWIQRLVEVGLWTVEDKGFRDTRYLELNPTAEKAKAKRAVASRKQALFRDAELREAIRKRDRNMCRYCAVKVRWHDRKGPGGGTYDHVDPEGPNSLENVVVACRGCNSSKKDRTPQRAGMILLPEPATNFGSKSRSKSDLDRASPLSHPPNGGKGARVGRDARPSMPPWCGRCHHDTRMTVADDNSSVPCPTCHPDLNRSLPPWPAGSAVLGPALPDDPLTDWS